MQSDILYKQASIVDTITSYITQGLGGDNNIDKLFNFLGPSVISGLFGLIGFPKFGILLGIASSAYGFDFADVVNSIHEQIKSALAGSGQITPDKVHNIVSTTVGNNLSNNTPATTSQASRADRLHKLSCVINKYAATPTPSKEFVGGKLIKALSWLFRVALSSTGFLVAGNITRDLLGIKKNEPAAAPAATSTQTKFKVNPSYSPENNNSGDSIWVESVSNNKSGIENMLLQFTKTVYSGLNNLDNIIRSTNGFQDMVDEISWYNRYSKDEPHIVIPKTFTSKKSIVDHFIDEIAQRSH